jgi:hypothetical protein
MQNPVDAPPVVRVEPVVKLVQQEPIRILYEGAGQESKTLLSIRQGQKFAGGVTVQTKDPQSAGHPLRLRRRNGQQQEIRAMQAGRNQVANWEVPSIARIFVLLFCPDIGNPPLGFDQTDFSPAHAIDSNIVSGSIRAGRSGPDIAAQKLQQLRLARAVLTEQRPTLPRL